MQHLRLFPLFILLSFSVYAQKPESPEPAVPNIIGKLNNVRDFTISPNGNEAYFTVMSPASEVTLIVRIEKSKNKWSEPEIASFSGKHTDFEAAFSPNGLRLYFSSNRPLDDNGNRKDFDIWYVERSNPKAKWSQPKNIGAPVNTTGNEFYPSIAESGNLYFTTIKPESKSQDDIYVSEWNGTAYKEPKALSDAINTSHSEFNAYVSPDESFIIYTHFNFRDRRGNGDLHISYKGDNDTWSKAVSLGDQINSDKVDYCPFVHLESETLYFTSKRDGYTSGEQGYTDYKTLLKQLNRYDNGSSRVYKVVIGDLLKTKR